MADASVADAPPPSSAKGEVLDRLHRLTEDLASAHRQLADLLKAELEQRVAAWGTARPEDWGQKDSITARDRIADGAVLDLSADVIEIKGEIAAMREEKEWCQLLLAHLS